jgi:hypothetical protein
MLIKIVGEGGVTVTQTWHLERCTHEPDWRVTANDTRDRTRQTLMSFAQYATTTFFPHFVGDAGPREPHRLGKRCVRPA